MVTASINSQVVASKVDVGSGKGYIAMGTSGYFPVEFNNFKLSKGSITNYSEPVHRGLFH